MRRFQLNAFIFSETFFQCDITLVKRALMMDPTLVFGKGWRDYERRHKHT